MWKRGELKYFFFIFFNEERYHVITSFHKGKTKGKNRTFVFKKMVSIFVLEIIFLFMVFIIFLCRLCATLYISALRGHISEDQPDVIVGGKNLLNLGQIVYSITNRRSPLFFVFERGDITWKRGELPNFMIVDPTYTHTHTTLC